MVRPFEGIKVLDATHVLAGPYCGYQLALLGAETIKIENPDDPDPVRTRGPVAVGCGQPRFTSAVTARAKLPILLGKFSTTT